MSASVSINSKPGDTDKAQAASIEVGFNDPAIKDFIETKASWIRG